MILRAILTVCILASPLRAERVAGTVVNAVSGQPIAGARVTITLAAGGAPISTLSGEDGNFSFPDVPPGRYALSGERRGYLARTCTIVSGHDSFVLRLEPPAVIAGKVVDDAGDPVAQASVELLSSRVVAGRRQLVEEASKPTADSGDYRFWGLPAGNYYLVVSGVPWYSRFGETLGDDAPRQMTHTGYAVRYYPNTGDPAAAEPLALKAGQEVAADFTLLPVPAASVFVHVDGGDSLTKQYTLTAGGPLRAVEIRQGSQTGGDLFNLWNIAPGRYTLRAHASDGQHTWYGTTEFRVTGEDLNIDVTLRPAPKLSGTITLPATVLLESEDGRSQSLAAGTDGRFSLAVIHPGRYRVSLDGAGDVYLKTWAVDGGRRDGDFLVIPPAADVRLRLQAAHGSARITGTVYRDGHPFAGALTVLAPIGLAMQSATDGSFEFRGLAEGDYAVFAVEDGSDFEYATPAVIAPYLRRAQKVHTGSDHVRLPL